MKVIKINKNKWADGLNKLRSAYQCIGPVKKDTYHDFQLLGKDQLPDFDYLNTRMSPKSITFPQSEIMMEYSLDESQKDHHIMKEYQKESPPRAVFGIRPCDAKALTLVKLNFDTSEYQDPYWLKAYDATTLIGMACDEPATTCFCTSTGCGPYNEEGLDVLLADEGDNYLAKVITKKGEQLFKTAGWEDTSCDTSAMDSKKGEAEAKITSTVATENLKEKVILDLYEAPFWEDTAFSCLNCGTCTYVCPTCWCFDIQDETYGKNGIRMRNWDSCMFPLFTLHTTGHNPRETKLHRVRQRFMHKLKYFTDKYEKGIMCVGCGRCVRLCPVNIDIRTVCDKMNNYVASG